MVLLLTCEQCDKPMKTLEQHIIKYNKYLCVPCGNSIDSEDLVKKFYENLDPEEFVGIGFMI